MMAWLLGLPTLDPAALHRRMQDERLVIFDLNSEASWRQARVPGARRLDPNAFAAEELPADHNAPLVFYCSNPLCRKAPLAARRARQLGYQKVQVLSAGISGWLDAGLPVESGGGS
jgi:rhodanese-related sulfurtransferase